MGQLEQSIDLGGHGARFEAHIAVERTRLSREGLQSPVIRLIR